MFPNDHPGVLRNFRHGTSRAVAGDPDIVPSGTAIIGRRPKAEQVLQVPFHQDDSRACVHCRWKAACPPDPRTIRRRSPRFLVHRASAAIPASRRAPTQREEIHPFQAELAEEPADLGQIEGRRIHCVDGYRDASIFQDFQIFGYSSEASLARRELPVGVVDIRVAVQADSQIELVSQQKPDDSRIEQRAVGGQVENRSEGKFPSFFPQIFCDAGQERKIEKGLSAPEMEMERGSTRRREVFQEEVDAFENSVRIDRKDRFQAGGPFEAIGAAEVALVRNVDCQGFEATFRGILLGFHSAPPYPSKSFNCS